MSFTDGEMQAVSILGALILTASLSLPVAYLTRKADSMPKGVSGRTMTPSLSKR